MKHEGWDLGVCGINCAGCALLKQSKCSGCRGPKDKHWSADCAFLACAGAKGHTYCHECDDFPCAHVKAFEADEYEHHTVAVRNMERMREIGVDAWIEKQPKVMYCPGWKF